MAGMAGVTAMLVMTAGVTLAVVVPDTDPLLAVITELPTPVLLASPWLSTVITAAFAEDQFTTVVRSNVLPSL
jgi:hypothetical protein